MQRTTVAGTPGASTRARATRRAAVASVSLSPVHGFSKTPALEVRLLTGLGVEGDAHCGRTVRHRFARRRQPEQPNLRQVHLLATELLDDLAGRGFPVQHGDLGENITTTGVDLLALPAGTLLRLGSEAVVELTGLRTPCRLIDGHRRGLMKQMWGTTPGGRRFRRAGVMGVVAIGGVVRPDDPLTLVLPPGLPSPLLPV